MLDSTEEVERRLIAAAPGALALIERLEAEIPSGDEVTLELPDLDLRRRLDLEPRSTRPAPRAIRTGLGPPQVGLRLDTGRPATLDARAVAALA